MVNEPSTTLYNQMIRAFSRSATPDTSLKFYNRMRASAMTQPNSFTFAFLLGACAAAGTSLLKQGEQLHARILSAGFGADVYVQTNLVNMYAAVADAATIAKARKVFNDMPHRNVVSWNAMLAGYLRSGDTSSAFQLFDQMPERNAVSWTTMIAGCAQNGRSRQALTLFREMRRARIGADQIYKDQSINSYWTCHHISHTNRKYTMSTIVACHRTK
ncbi:putative Pentatricopeptide repeat-containing protein, chloroplastic [Cocos nucifera]|uniref:Putative Pentatricopeptide repeat-containing protein, chloroplastic n=1 Tax=Cocos nucifera TaxID=13894 RepID=A0A8K0N1Q6_COCNU|nr:putative Pentatricopeptide repeat-containing protein, chloroplastic [Cocos nucifera]